MAGMRLHFREFDEIVFFERLLKKNPDYVHALISLAEAYTAKGLYRKGLQVDKRLAKLCPRDPIVYYNLACSYALVGQKEFALSALRRAIRMGYRDFNYLRKDPDLKSLHGDPRFKTLVSDRSSLK
jgi:tetratricopeptide (TPR) repeat protein